MSALCNSHVALQRFTEQKKSSGYRTQMMCFYAGEGMSAYHCFKVK